MLPVYRSCGLPIGCGIIVKGKGRLGAVGVMAACLRCSIGAPEINVHLSATQLYRERDFSILLCQLYSFHCSVAVFVQYIRIQYVKRNIFEGIRHLHRNGLPGIEGASALPFHYIGLRIAALPLKPSKISIFYTVISRSAVRQAVQKHKCFGRRRSLEPFRDFILIQPGQRICQPHCHISRDPAGVLTVRCYCNVIYSVFLLLGKPFCTVTRTRIIWIYKNAYPIFIIAQIAAGAFFYQDPVTV